ncbi:Photosynthesis system II assembly factor YCF48 [Mucilaginibacter pineti]|uniref:Photosynthesis system II assembly factor YCF48 n=1 Tax=Mucilaginibacter pineti TaxID=1391627 RepID=A0A1G7GLC5_9SPHI|nr:YCF48-related protein [Mucilaginibacter pineti]SDE88789.1 Photosynthesis system II assembly factor YCF48 [Mucilaginibacter pineti]
MKISIRIAFITLCYSLTYSNSKAQKITIIQQDKPTSIRGLSVVNDKTAWISGSKGYIAITNDGGKTWDWQQIKNYEQADFRDIEAFSNKEAIIMSSGTPALILKTIDGGKTWQEKFNKADSAYFLDAMDFIDPKHGYILGDPIKNKFLLMETKDGGETWAEMQNTPEALPGEAAFAASGTCLRVNKDLGIIITSGGTVARLLQLCNYDKAQWQAKSLPIAQAANSKGAFSISDDMLVAVGGNYAKNKLTDSVICRYDKKSAQYQVLQAGATGFQSCVERVWDRIYLSTGTSGSSISNELGSSWKKIDNTSFNVCRKAKYGKLILLAGDKGKIGTFKM